MMLWNLLTVFYIVSADVVRDDWYHDYEGQFTVVNKGRMLRVLMYFNNVQPGSCALHCVRHIRCKTFNYHPIKQACELTDEYFNKMDADKISSGWYNHGTPPKVNGGWSSWRNFTDCTKKCGNGTLEQWRDCDSPKPDHGGADCKGRMRRRIKCNTHECEVVNVALHKTAKQSSILYPSFDIYAPSNAVDGDTSTSSSTEWEINQWWEVDMGEVRVIKHIHLMALFGVNENRGLLVETKKNKDDNWILCRDIGDLTDSVTKFKCNDQSTRAQFLRIQSTIKSYLDLSEVEIFGY